MTTPACPKCGDARQIWANQLTGRLTCHRIHCHTEIEMKPHPHADFLRALADGVPITDFEVIYKTRENWEPISDFVHSALLSLSDIQIRRKPQTHVVNGFTVPAPLRISPDLSATYYVPDWIDGGFYRGALVWNADRIDIRHLSRGLVHLTKEAAIANAKATCGIDPWLDGAAASVGDKQ